VDQGQDPKLEGFVREALPRLREAFAPLHVVIFGSRVRGDALSTSDLDVILVSPRFGSMRFLERPVRALETLGYPGGIEFLCYTPDEFETKREELGIVRIAVETGISL
jgi:predicted nucleotidyltransferase